MRTLADGLTATHYRHIQVEADVTHRYAVQAYNSSGSSLWSEPAADAASRLPWHRRTCRPNWKATMSPLPGTGPNPCT